MATTSSTSSTGSSTNSVTGMNFSNVTRITGLASGVDVDTLVQKLMAAEEIPLNQMQQQQQTLQWEQDDYRTINSSLLDYTSNKLLNFNMQSTFQAKAVTLGGNTTAVSATADTTAQNGTMTLEVSQLATAASNYSNGDIRLDTTFDPNKTLASQNGKLNGDMTLTYDFTINGTAIHVDPNTESLNQVLSDINTKTNVNAYFDSSTGQVSFMSKQTGLVNGASGTSATIDFQDTTGTFLGTTLKVTNGNTATEKAAQNAALTINGMATTRTSNSFTVNGAGITLLQTNVGNPTTVTIGTDTASIMKSIKQFVTDYNTQLAQLYSKVDEQKYPSYQPLSDAQKSQMSDTQIQEWESKAKSGLLQNDDLLTTAIDNMRYDAVAAVQNTGSSTYNSLASIGISSTSWEDNGQLTVDDTKLQAAIEADPTAVMNLFTQKGTASDGSDNGIANRLNKDLQNTMQNLTSKAGTSSALYDNSIIGQQLSDLSTKISDEESHLSDVENQYYNQFTQMEQAISQYNSQGSYLMSFFGGSGGSGG